MALFSALRRYLPEIEILASTNIYGKKKCIITKEERISYVFSSCEKLGVMCLSPTYTVKFFKVGAVPIS